MKAIVTVGVSASGKSTFASELVSQGWAEVNRDICRASIFFEKTGKPFEFWKDWNWKWEKEVTAAWEAALLRAHTLEKNVIISDTNLNTGRRDALVSKLEKMGYEVEVKVFHIPYEEAVRRDVNRLRPVGAEVIGKQFKQFRETVGSVVVQDLDLPSAYIFDIDGTLAHKGDRDIYDYASVWKDWCDPSVKEILLALSGSNEIIILSGREDSCADVTIEWLKDNGIPYQHLFMRRAGDHRSDTIVKQELFENYVKGIYNVNGVVDDRPKVCRMWRDLGLKVFQVGDPHVEF